MKAYALARQNGFLLRNTIENSVALCRLHAIWSSFSKEPPVLQEVNATWTSLGNTIVAHIGVALYSWNNGLKNFSSSYIEQQIVIDYYCININLSETNGKTVRYFHCYKIALLQWTLTIVQSHSGLKKLPWLQEMARESLLVLASYSKILNSVMNKLLFAASYKCSDRPSHLACIRI